MGKSGSLSRFAVNFAFGVLNDENEVDRMSRQVKTKPPRTDITKRKAKLEEKKMSSEMQLISETIGIAKKRREVCSIHTLSTLTPLSKFPKLNIGLKN